MEERIRELVANHVGVCRRVYVGRDCHWHRADWPVDMDHCVEFEDLLDLARVVAETVTA